MIYRATTDGDDCKTYHQKTNNIPDTLTIIKTKKGNIFGGFTHIKIPSCQYGTNFHDENAFLFSLDHKKLYLSLKNEDSKHSNDSYGPIFGNNNKGYPIKVNVCNFFKSSGSTCVKENGVYNNFEFDYELNKGDMNFEINEIEVFQILFEE